MNAKFLSVMAVLAFSSGACNQAALAQGQRAPDIQVQPYGNPYGNPYANPYGNPYVNPYATAPNGTFGINGVNNYPYGGYYPGAIGQFSPYQWGGGVPMNLGGAAFSARLGNTNINFWKAPSGYYYPWMGRPMIYAPIVFVDPNAGSQAQAKLPPLTTQFSDTSKFLDDSFKDKKLTEGYYNSFKRRCADIKSKFNSYQVAQGGQLDSGIEGEIRTDLDNLNKEMAEHISP
jgi:hypothetical protein